ncbi:hypothetical protein [Conexibacter sp. DBS9H8]|uniref:DUF7405 family protein n=1 Tax=Conexibacter sp. DBS9H8 TaxID=2937801 RepID=UPI00200C339A|nr:hypothetical protein [Conexibacter sp. DBS9H8]
MNAPEETSGLSRRRFLTGAGVAAGAVITGAAIDGCATTSAPAAAVLPRVTLPPPVPGLPVRQHAWNATLHTDRYGNALPPRFDRLLFFDVKGGPTPAHARILEAGLRALEHRYPWGPGGLLITAGWGPHYFTDLLKRTSPVPPARALSDFEAPSIDHYDLCLHLACDDERRLGEAQVALLRGPEAITPALQWRETRTGFTGSGLPAAHQHVQGIPAGDPVPADAPLYMGFKSALKGNQATEDAVTIPSGPFREGTTMTVSYMTLSLENWYDNLDEAQRIARMYAPQMTVADQRAITTDAESDPNLIGQAIRRDGVIGHSQACARARRNGKAIILRRDFDTTDGGQAGLHFVALQRDIADFVTTRTAMNQAGAQLINPAITATTNNGINEFIFVLKRANYVLPSRPERAFPLLPGRAAALQQTS